MDLIEEQDLAQTFNIFISLLIKGCISQKTSFKNIDLFKIEASPKLQNLIRLVCHYKYKNRISCLMLFEFLLIYTPDVAYVKVSKKRPPMLTGVTF